MKTNKKYEKVISCLGEKYELVGKILHPNFKGEFCWEETAFKVHVMLEGKDFPLRILATRFFRDENIILDVADFCTGYPLSDFDWNDYLIVMRNTTTWDMDTCYSRIQGLKEAMEKASREVGDYLNLLRKEL